jgi:DNA-binding MarR family transcriptional regulator
VLKIRDPGAIESLQPNELRKWMRRIERKIDVLVKSVEKGRVPKLKEVEGITEALDVMTLLSLPDHLRKSALTIVKLKRAMAEDVARETGRARAIESAYLNQLVRMGYLERMRDGKRVYFMVKGNSDKGNHRLSAKKGGD